LPSKRVLRVAESLKRELSFILDRKLGDPKIGMVTITRVELSDDLRHARIYVSFLGGADAAESMKRLRHAGRFLRAELSHALDLRVVPRLLFILDDSAENYIRIAEVLKAIHEEAPDDTSRASDRGDPTDDDDE